MVSETAAQAGADDHSLSGWVARREKTVCETIAQAKGRID